MAKRRKRKHSNKRVGAVRRKGLDLGKVLTMVAGGIVGDVAIGMAESKISNENAGKFAAAGAIALGLFLPKFVKSNTVGHLADGIAVAGGIRLVQEFGLLGSIPFVAGWNSNTFVSGVGALGCPQRQLNESAQSLSISPTVAQMMSGYARRQD